MSDTAIDVTVEAEDASGSLAQEQPEISVDDLKKLLAREKTRATEAEQREQAARREAETARGSFATEAEARFNAEFQGVESSLAGRASELAGLKADYRRHIEAAEWDAASDVNVKIAEAAAEMRDLRRSKEWLNTNKDALLAQARQQQQPAPADGYTPRERQWIKDHPEYLSDDEFQADVSAASVLAQKRGLKRDSEEYIEFIEKRVGLKQPAAPAKTDDDPPPPPRQRQPAAPAAPVTRHVPGSTTPRGQVVAQLSQNERGAAIDLYSGKTNPDTGKVYTEAEMLRRYAINKETMKARGHYQ